MKIVFLFTCTFFMIYGCNKINNKEINPPSKDMPHISASGNRLVTENGATFRVWGFNWGGGAMLEDLWHTDWNGLKDDFKEMRGYGANTVRLPLQYRAFMTDVNTPNNTSLLKLRQLVKVAEDNNLYLIVCGLNAFVKEAQPAWYNNLSDADRWKTQAVFWEAVAGAIGDSPAILSYDLMNEPVVGVDPANGWLPGAGFGGFFFVQNIALNPEKRPIEQVIREWIQTMTTAIRKKDQRHLITTGFLSFGLFALFAPDLGMMSTHLYPKSGAEHIDSLAIQKFKSDKPLIISEIFPMHFTDAELQQFIIKQNQNVSGWVWHYNGKTLEELQSSGTLPDAVYRAALLRFIEMAPSQK